MEKTDKLILVTGATGRQGGAVARQLVAKGWQVRTMTRNPEGSAAKSLAEQGAEVVAGDFDDIDSLKKAVSDTYGVFSVQNFWEVGAEREIQQGKNIANVAEEVGVQHFVYTSVGAATRHTGLPHFESKFQIEKHIRSLELPATMLRPVAFMENYYIPQVYDRLMKGKLADPVRADVTLQLIAADDIGAFAALVFEKPDDFFGKAIEIAGDQLSNLEIAATFGKAMGIPVRFKKMPMPMVRLFMGKEMHQMFKWFNQEMRV